MWRGGKKDRFSMGKMIDEEPERDLEREGWPQG